MKNLTALCLAITLGFPALANAETVNCTLTGTRTNQSVNIDLSQVVCNFSNHTHTQAVDSYKNDEIQRVIDSLYENKVPVIVRKWTLQKGENFMTKMGFRTSGQGYLEDYPKADKILFQLRVEDPMKMPVGFTWCLLSDGSYSVCSK